MNQKTVDNTLLGYEVPSSIQPIMTAVKAARWMLSLKDDWDDEGSPGYAEETWERTGRFLLSNALALWQDGILIDAPAVHNGPQGSIDIYWDSPKRTLLINVPAATGENGTFYGRDAQGSEIRGCLDFSEGGLPFSMSVLAQSRAASFHSP
jgi:hypothetical protein